MPLTLPDIEKVAALCAPKWDRYYTKAKLKSDPVYAAIEDELQRAVAVMIAAALEMKTAVAPPDAVRPEREQGRLDGQAVERQLSVWPQCQGAARDGQSASQTVEESIIQPPHLRHGIAAKADPPIGTRRRAELGRQVNDTQTPNEQTANLAVQAEIIAAAFQVEPHHQLALKFV